MNYQCLSDYQCRSMARKPHICDAAIPIYLVWCMTLTSRAMPSTSPLECVEEDLAGVIARNRARRPVSLGYVPGGLEKHQFVVFEK